MLYYAVALLIIDLFISNRFSPLSGFISLLRQKKTFDCFRCLEIRTKKCALPKKMQTYKNRMTSQVCFKCMYGNIFLQVDVVNNSASVNLDNYIFSGEWELLGVEIVRNEEFYACCDVPYPDVTFYISMRRRTLYYLFNIIFPCLWLTVLSLLGFWLPPDSGEKITLGITVLLAFSVFMLLIAESMPATSEFVPLIGKEKFVL